MRLEYCPQARMFGRHSLSVLPQLSLPDEATHFLPFSLGCGPLLPTPLPTFLSTLADQSEHVLESRDSTMHAGTMPTVSPRAWRRPLPSPPVFCCLAVWRRPWLWGHPVTPQSLQSANSVMTAISSANQVRTLEVRRLWRYVRSKERSMMHHHPVASISSSKMGVLGREETSMGILKLGNQL